MKRVLFVLTVGASLLAIGHFIDGVSSLIKWGEASAQVDRLVDAAGWAILFAFGAAHLGKLDAIQAVISGASPASGSAKVASNGEPHSYEPQTPTIG